MLVQLVSAPSGLKRNGVACLASRGEPLLPTLLQSSEHCHGNGEYVPWAMGQEVDKELGAIDWSEFASPPSLLPFKEALLLTCV